jgi:hypothetical protein
VASTLSSAPQPQWSRPLCTLNNGLSVRTRTGRQHNSCRIVATVSRSLAPASTTCGASDRVGGFWSSSLHSRYQPSKLRLSGRSRSTVPRQPSGRVNVADSHLQQSERFRRRGPGWRGRHRRETSPTPTTCSARAAPQTAARARPRYSPTTTSTGAKSARCFSLCFSLSWQALCALCRLHRTVAALLCWRRGARSR